MQWKEQTLSERLNALKLAFVHECFHLSKSFIKFLSLLRLHPLPFLQLGNISNNLREDEQRKKFDAAAFFNKYEPQHSLFRSEISLHECSSNKHVYLLDWNWNVFHRKQYAELINWKLIFGWQPGAKGRYHWIFIDFLCWCQDAIWSDWKMEKGFSIKSIPKATRKGSNCGVNKFFIASNFQS